MDDPACRADLSAAHPPATNYPTPAPTSSIRPASFLAAIAREAADQGADELVELAKKADKLFARRLRRAMV